MLPVFCHDCGHQFERSGSGLFEDGLCPRCGSSDLDVNEKELILVHAASPLPDLPDSDLFYLVDSNMEPLTHGQVYDAPPHLYGSLLWSIWETRPFPKGTIPPRGNNHRGNILPIREAMPASQYQAVYRDGRYLMVSRPSSKVAEIQRSILASNPDVSKAQAEDLAREAIRRFPRVVGD